MGSSIDPKLFEQESANPHRRAINEAYEKEYMLYMAALKAKAGKNLYLFNKYILDVEHGDVSFVPLAPFHRELCNFITDRTDKKKLILIPRGHLKTKLATIGYSLFKIINNPKIRILVYSATWQMAVDINLSIQKQLAGCEILHNLYGDLIGGASEWSQDRTRLLTNDKREPTVTSAGIDNNLVGGHYDLIIMDDVVNRDNIATMDQTLKVIQRYKDSLDLLEPGGELVVIGTRWHDADLYGWIMSSDNNVAQNYLIMKKQAYEGNLETGEDFVPLWPDKFSREELLRRLSEEGWYHFSAQYLNEPVPEQDAVFKREWFSHYEEDYVRGKILNKFLSIDPALSLSQDADYTAFVVVGVDEWGQILILDLLRKKMSPNDLINMIFFMREKWSLNDVGIETTAFQKVLAYSLREDSRFKRRPFHITELKSNERSKEQRIRALQPLYENRKIFHSKALPNNVYLEDELIRFPRSTHDDLIDALSFCLDFIFPSRQKTKGEGKRKYLYNY